MSVLNLRPVRATALPRWMIAVADQGLVAVVNLVLSIGVTHQAGVSALGGFTIITTTILIMAAVTRILVSDPWLASRNAGRVPSPQQRWLVLLAAAASTVVVGVAVVLGLDGGAPWWWACAIAPLVILQDFGRYSAFRREVPARALASDAAILGVGAATFAVWALVAGAHLTAILVSWFVGLVVSLVVAFGTRFGKVSASGSRAWWRATCKPLATKLAQDGLAFQVGVSGSLFLLAAKGSHQDVGMVRAIQSMFSPLLLTITGLTMWLVPFLAHRGTARMLDVRRRATALLALVSIVGVALAVWLGPWVVSVLFGAEATPDRLSMLLAGGWAAAAAVASPWLASIRVSGKYAAIAWTRTVGAVLACLALALLPWASTVNGFLALLAFQYGLVAVAAFVVGSRITQSSSEELLAET